MRVALIGNCQVQSLASLFGLMVDDLHLSVFDYSESYSREEENRKRFSATLPSMDFVFAQTALMSYTSEKDLRPALGSKLVTIGNFYFRGLFPDSCYIGDFESRLNKPSLVHSVVVLDAYRRGMSEAQANRHFSIGTLEQLGVLSAWSSSMLEMSKREANGVVDVPVAQFMEEACRRYHAFLTMNHPAARLLVDYLARVLDHVGVKHRVPPVGTYADVLAVHDTTPIYDFVGEFYRLEYKADQNWKVNMLGGHVSREDYVAACYNAYGHVNRSSLIVHSPTDMVEHLLASSEYYLVDGEAPAPSQARVADDSNLSPAMILTPRQLTLALRPVIESIDKWGAFVDRIHSHTQIMDPKLERLFQAVLKSEAQDRKDEALQRINGLYRNTKILAMLFLLSLIGQIAGFVLHR